MKKLGIALLGTVLCAVSAVATAQLRINPINHFYVEEVQNPGFEGTTFSPWNNSQGVQSVGGDYNIIPLGYVNNSHHTGSHAFDMNVGQGGYNGYYECNLYQALGPFSASNLINGSVWALAGSQYLDVTIYYSDGTTSYASNYFDAESALESNPMSGGWQQWNFTSIINKTKTITGIQFTADSFEGDDIIIDDVEMLCMYTFYNF